MVSSTMLDADAKADAGAKAVDCVGVDVLGLSSSMLLLEGAEMRR